MAYIEIDSSNYFYNLNQIAKKTGSADKIFAVLKDNAYGHGLLEIASLAKKFGIKRVVVKNLKEALAIENMFEEILILSEIPKKEIPKNISVTINDINDLKILSPKTNIHLKIDTGMHRNGIEAKYLKKALSLIKEKRLNLLAVMTHFRSADELSSELFWQKKVWNEIKAQAKNFCKSLHLQTPLFHSNNSAALFRLKTFDEDFARCGIATYGYLEIDSIFGNFNLKPVLKLWANKISSRDLKKGERVGYGGVFEAKEDMKISTYDIGYGDGFFRSDGKKNLKTADGKKILGRISMDSFVCEGDEEKILLIDNAKQTAKVFNTISYEITTKLSPFIKRIVI